MEKTLYSRVTEVLEALPEGSPKVQVLKVIFEEERKKNTVLDRIIRQETSCVSEVGGLMHFVNSLRWNEPAEGYVLDKDLKYLVETEELFSAPRIGAWFVSCEQAYEPASYWMSIPLATLILAIVFLGMFSQVLELPTELGLGFTVVFFVLLIFGLRYLSCKSWIKNRKCIAKKTLARAGWLDEQIRLVYKGE